MGGVERDNRHLKRHPCPVCQGYDEAPRGKRVRCNGFTSADGEWCRCSREELAGGLDQEDGLFRHKMHGECRCGETHAPAQAVEPEALYDYTDEAGDLLFQVVRKPGKKFLQRRPDPSATDGWTWKTQGMRMVLYRLPALLAADPATPVYVVEGEKDADTGARAGLLTTCNPRGAGKWKSVAADARNVLAGRTVVVVADKDEPGRAHAAQVAESLRGSAASVRMVEAPAAKDLAAHLAAGGTVDDLVTMGAVVVPSMSIPPGEMQEIRISLKLADVVDATDAALKLDPTLFERDHELVTVVAAGKQTQRATIATGTPIIRPILPPTLIERLSRIAQFVRKSKPTKKAIAMAEAGIPVPDDWTPCLATPAIVNALLARGQWDVPPLVGVSETPILRRDGSIHDTPGYDVATGYYYSPSCVLPPLPTHPTRDDAVAALAQLEDAFVDFPHVDRAHKLVPVAAILTLLARTAIDGSVPLFVLDASTRGSGKTLQADVVSLVALGRDAGRLTHPDTDEELEKVLSAYALFGARLILIDNICRELGGGPLDKVLTTRTDVELRVLGASTIRRLPWSAVILASGNNVGLGDDTLRRTLVSRLESDLENPEARTGFVHDPLHSWVRAERPMLLRAALIVLRAYAAKGWPQTDVPRWGSFESWTTIVAGAIRFAGGPSILTCKPRAEERGDGTVAALSVVLRDLPRLGQGPSIKLRAAIQSLYPHDDGHPREPDGFDELREAFEIIAPPRVGQHVDPKVLGQRLNRMAGRLVGGRRLRHETGHAGTKAWFVTDAEDRRISPSPASQTQH